MTASSELVAQRHLHAAFGARRQDGTERGISLLSRGVELRRGVDGGPLRMVEQVVDLPAQLELVGAVDREVLEDRQIVIVESGQQDLGFVTVVADLAGTPRTLEHAGVEPPRLRSITTRQVGVAGLDEGLTTSGNGLARGEKIPTGPPAAGEVEVVGVGGGPVRPRAGGERADARDLPVVENPARGLPLDQLRPVRD